MHNGEAEQCQSSASCGHAGGNRPVDIGAGRTRALPAFAEALTCYTTPSVVGVGETFSLTFSKDPVQLNSIYGVDVSLVLPGGGLRQVASGDYFTGPDDVLEATFTVGQTHQVPGQYTYLVTLDGPGGEHEEARCSLAVSSPTVMVADPAVVQLAPPRLYFPNVSARLTYDPSGAPVPGRTVRFVAGSSPIPICSAVTDADGVASCAGSVTGILATILNQGYRAVFDGDVTSGPSSDGAPLVR